MTPRTETLQELVERHLAVPVEMRCRFWPDCPFPKDDHYHDFRVTFPQPTDWNTGGCEYERVQNSVSVPDRRD